ncbi:hypothetical protein CHGG_05341 [Chaetomium globosum CBS 148.51]|uniref:Aerobactin siderophore biosynthesis IucA/IucC-like C-terminal domain-containing protein n=1 Tax=Chaetomium globosum (strain ATCC 6205 / CBS 148.51 / DSM 1962 / NBRC 6347 / NRRL 1970) TaxID=306901 RepID=Q2H7M4_CHAGB|nr:uncharacterized protein CHGG_05341 [Chaetomium globosum CBS 148.51]EAQ88722.1 hypothetical protein CHGG_05341 [Chaetomium globosum CBS 148.51]
MARTIRGELENSADNQEQWLKFERSQPPPQLGSPLIVWEQRLFKGHPTHPYLGTDAIRVGSSELYGLHQASMRTISIPDFPFHVKMALSFTITSARRTMTPWTTRMCIEVSRLLQDIADPELLWIALKRAAACSANRDFEAAKHLSVMLREDPEPRARELGQCLVLPAALFELRSEDRVAPVVELFNLEPTLEARKNWFRNYARLYLQAVLPPLLSYGICLEAHLQNVLARFDVETGALRGFVYRDMGGLRMHLPTMKARGIGIKSADLVPGAVTLTDDLEAVWINAYHNLVVNHMGGALRGMGLQWDGGWDILKEELKQALEASPDPDNKTAELLEFMVRPTMKRKAFLRMQIAGIYRDSLRPPSKSFIHPSKGIGGLRELVGQRNLYMYSRLLAAQMLSAP